MGYKLKYYLLLTRPLNLAIIACTQLVFIYHSASYDLSNIHWSQSISVILATILTAAAGFVINDIFDIEEDQINNPEKRIIASKISIVQGKIFYSILAFASLAMGYYSGITMGFLCLSLGIMLFFYSSDLKGETLWGNLLVAFMTGAVVFIADLGVFTRMQGYFAEYSLLAFLITMAREIVKDMEDIEGDKAQEYRTFPIVYGIKKSALLAATFLFLMVVLVLYVMVNYGNIWYNIFAIAFVVIPAVFLSVYLQLSAAKEQFHRISVYLKLLMVTGIFSVLGL